MQRIRLTEDQLNRVVMNTVKRVIKEQRMARKFSKLNEDIEDFDSDPYQLENSYPMEDSMSETDFEDEPDNLD